VESGFSLLQEEERGNFKTPYVADANLRDVVVYGDGVEFGQKVKYLAYSSSRGSPTLIIMSCFLYLFCSFS
jgi:hypothetical protein